MKEITYTTVEGAYFTFGFGAPEFVFYENGAGEYSGLKEGPIFMVWVPSNYGAEACDVEPITLYNGDSDDYPEGLSMEALEDLRIALMRAAKKWWKKYMPHAEFIIRGYVDDIELPKLYEAPVKERKRKRKKGRFWA
jgi:hypothetical protein